MQEFDISPVSRGGRRGYKNASPLQFGLRVDARLSKILQESMATTTSRAIPWDSDAQAGIPRFSLDAAIPGHRILAFGKWGTYKRLELMIEAFQIVEAALPGTSWSSAVEIILKLRAMWNP